MKGGAALTDLTILMPCLNEEENLAYCIKEAGSYLASRHLAGEILIADNGSEDRSAEIADEMGARVVHEPRRGYGSALRRGFSAAEGNVIIFGDCDSTYDFSDLDAFYEPLSRGETDFVTGDRFTGLMEDGAMSLAHRLGVPFLSWCGRVKFGVNVHDWHCGIRGIRRDALKRLDLRCDGMEFATELLAEIARKNLRFKEVPVPLRKSREKRTEKLRTVRDGFRHLIYIIK